MLILVVAVAATMLARVWRGCWRRYDRSLPHIRRDVALRGDERGEARPWQPHTADASGRGEHTTGRRKARRGHVRSDVVGNAEPEEALCVLACGLVQSGPPDLIAGVQVRGG